MFGVAWRAFKWSVSYCNLYYQLCWFVFDRRDVGSAANIFPANKQSLLFVSTGILGGFTTFSTFSLETFGLIEESRYAMAGLYAISSVVVCVLGVCIGRMIARAVVGQS